MTIDMTTVDPSEIIVGPGGQTLTQAAAAEQAAPRTVRVDDLARYREILDEVAAAATALRAAGVDRITVDLALGAPPNGVEIVVRAAEPYDDDDATVPAWTAPTQIAEYARPAVLALLPAAARAMHDGLTVTDPNGDGDLWIECACGGCGSKTESEQTNEHSTYMDRPIAVQRQMERARMRGDWVEWRRLARTNEARRQG